MMKQTRNNSPLRLVTLLVGLFILSVSAIAQTLTVKGHVKDAKGEPVIGATVRVAGSSAATVSDFDGNFTIKANAGQSLNISFVGYKPATARAAASVVVTLEDDATVLDNVVVIGYGVAKKNDLTGSVTAMKPDAKNKGLVVNAQDMIQGKIAGVNVITMDGKPGGDAQIRVRGGSSLNASNDPLIVIDGMAMDNDGVKGLSNKLSMINPQDIESFNVLKDASATAIYGSRGSNGVIIITTKKGRKGQAPSVSYSGSMTISTKKKTIDVLDGDGFRALVKNMYGDYVEGSDDPTDQMKKTAFLSTGDANTDWQDLIYRTAVSHDHNVTVSGAMKNLPYRVSLGYTNQQGILKTTGFERVTAALNLNPSLLNDHLTMNLNAKGMYARTQYADEKVVSSAVKMDPTQNPYAFTSVNDKATLAKIGDTGQTLKNFGGYFEWMTGASSFGDSTWPYTYNSTAESANPLALLHEKEDVAHSRAFIGSADIDYKVHGFEDLRLHLTLGADISKGRQNTYQSPAFPGSMYYGSNGYEEILKRNLSLSTYAQYYKDFAKIHHFDIMAGYEWQHFWRQKDNDYVGYYPMTNDDESLRGTERPHTPYKEKSESFLVSFFGRANYILLDRYYLTATVRRDGTSRFKDHWSTFPSFAFAYRINQEDFLKNVKWLSDLKLRLGWGMTGQQAGDKIDNYNWIASYSISTGTNGFYPVTGNGVLYRPNNYTPDLKWETTTTTNIGLDFGILDDALTMTVDAYYRKTKDLLNYAPLAAMAGYRNQAWQNIGTLENKGLEVAFDWKAIRTKDFFWTLNYNITYNKNEITDLTGVSENGAPVPNTDNKAGQGSGGYFQYNQVGYPCNSFYVYQQVYDQNGNPIENAVVDRDGDGKITENDRYMYKDPAPDVTMGLSSRMEYKNWDLSFTLRASFGNYVYDGINAGWSNMNIGEVYSNSLKYFSNRPVDAVARNWQTYELTSKMSDYWVKNASFLKCDNITLGYSFQNLFKSGSYKGISGRVYATVSNVFTITKYKGIDPEINNGWDNNLYPRPISYIVGLNLNF